jgi:hypothetical protein
MSHGLTALTAPADCTCWLHLSCLAGLFDQQLHSARQAVLLLLSSRGPLRSPGLAPAQRLMLSTRLAARCAALPLLLLALLPLLLIFGHIAPMSPAHLWELLAAYMPAAAALLLLVSLLLLLLLLACYCCCCCCCCCCWHATAGYNVSMGTCDPQASMVQPCSLESCSTNGSPGAAVPWHLAC